MSDFDSMTVADLKQRLKQEGLPVSGKKSELIERLLANVEGKNHPSENNSDQDLPFLSSLLQNGTSSVQFDLKLVLHYGVAVFMLMIFFIGLNSNSWYFMENTESDSSPEYGMYIDETVTVQFGLGDIEILYEAEGVAYGPIDEEMTESMEYDDSECKRIDEFSCDSFSSAGTLLQVCLWISILCILIILGLEISRGFGKEIPADFQIPEQTIFKLCWALSTSLPILATLGYRIIVGQSEMNMEGWDDYGFGGMWFTMFLFSVSFIIYIYYKQLSSIISKFVQT